MSNSERLETAIKEPDAFVAARALAIELRNIGMTQSEMQKLFDDARQRHSTDPDERSYNAILDVMDLINGWCSPGIEIYSP